MSDQKEEDIYCTISKDEVPPVPSNSFLMRKMNQQTDDAKTNKTEKNEARYNEERHRLKKNDDYCKPTDASGRKVKGRGAMVSSCNF